MATGKLDEAENQLADAVSAALRIRDNHKRSMKSAMQMRLLSIQRRLGHLQEALRTARSLIEEVCIPVYSHLIPDTVHWIFQQSLNLVNTLLCEGDAVSAYRSLGKLRNLGLSTLPVDIRSYIE